MKSECTTLVFPIGLLRLWSGSRMSGGRCMVNGVGWGRRVTLGEIRTSETSDSRCSFQKVHKIFTAGVPIHEKSLEKYFQGNQELY